MARATYTDEQRARAYVVLTTNQGNIKRTARDTSLPESTIRRWRDEWEEDGPPDTSLVAEATGDFVQEAERVRDAALAEMERKIPAATPSALVAMVGMLTDKIALARGLATSRSETVHSLPPAEEIARTLGAVLQGALAAAQSRSEDIIDAEIVEQAPAGELTTGV